MTPDFPPGTRVRVVIPEHMNGATGTVQREDPGFDNPGMAYVELDDGQVGLFWPETLERLDVRSAEPAWAPVRLPAPPVPRAFTVELTPERLATALAHALPAPEHVQAAPQPADVVHALTSFGVVGIPCLTRDLGPLRIVQAGNGYAGVTCPRCLSWLTRAGYTLNLAEGGR
jgi:hypothetical protein